MPKKDKKPANPVKFLFDINKFDDDGGDLPVPARDTENDAPPPPPPPPTYSEEELEAARKDGHARGRQDGLAEAQASREKTVAGIVDTISKNFAALFEAEDERAKRYEAEAVQLAADIFRKLFPQLNAQDGLGEINAVIARVLENNREQTGIIVEVHPDYVTDVEMHIRAALAGMHAAVNEDSPAKVVGNATLGAGEARLQWDSGGASRSAASLAAKIQRELDQVLAGKAILHDNKGSDGDHAATADDPQNPPIEDTTRHDASLDDQNIETSPAAPPASGDANDGTTGEEVTTP